MVSWSASKLNVRVAVGLGAAVFFLAILTLPHGLSDADNGEFLLVGVGGGIVHPPGYALYALLLQLWHQLESGSNTVRHMSGLSALLGAGAASFLFLFCRRMALSLPASAFATLATFGVLPLWRMNTLVEPFALHHLLAVMILWLTAGLNFRTPPFRDLVALGFLWGLSFCNHHTMVFLVPVVLWVALGQARQITALSRCLAPFILGFALGLLPLLSFFFGREDAVYIWGDWSEANRLWIHLFRMEYGTFQWAAAGAEEKGFALGFKGFVSSLTLGLSALGVVLAAVGTWRMFRMAQEPSKLFLARGLLLSLLLYLVVFLGFGNSICSDPLSSLLQRFLGLPFLLGAYFLGLGLDQCRLWYAQKHQSSLVSVIGFALVAFHLLWMYPLASRADETFVQTHLENVSGLIEDNDVVLARSDVEVFGLSFVQMQNKQTYTLVSLWLYSMDWYKKQLAQELNMPWQTLPKSVWDLLAQLNKKRRIVVLEPRTLGGHEIFQKNWYPLGPVFVVPPGTRSKPPVLELFEQNKQVFEERFHLPPKGWRSLKRKIERDFFFDYGLPWEILCDDLPAMEKNKKELSCGLATKMSNASRTQPPTKENASQ